MNILKILLAVFLLAAPAGLHAQGGINYKSPKNVVDVYITLPSAACDSIMIKSARYNCILTGFYNQLDKLSVNIPRTPEGRTQKKQLADRFTDYNREVRAKHEADMAPYLALVTPGTKLAIRNNSDKIEVLDATILDFKTPDRLIADRPVYEIKLGIKAVNKIPCQNFFNLTWNFMICDSQGRDVDIVPFKYSISEFERDYRNHHNGNFPTSLSSEWGNLIKTFDTGSEMNYHIYIRLTNIYDVRYNCTQISDTMNLDRLLTSQKPDSVRKPTTPRKPETALKPENVQEPILPIPGDTIVPPTPVDSLGQSMPENKPKTENGRKPKQPTDPRQRQPSIPNKRVERNPPLPPVDSLPPATKPKPGDEKHHHHAWRPKLEQADTIPPRDSSIVVPTPIPVPGPGTTPNPLPEPEPKPIPKPLPNQNYTIRMIGTHYSEGLLPVRSDGGKWGYVNVDGLWVIAPQFIKGSFSKPYFSDGVAVMQSGNNTVLLFPHGKIVALAKDIQNVSEFRNGYAMVQRRGENWTTKYGFIDKQGREVFPHLTKTGQSGDIYPLGKLSEGLMCYYDAEKRMFGYLDAAGKVVLQPQWEHAGDFSEGLAAAYGSDWGYIDLQGNWAIKPQWDYQDKPSDFHNGIAVANKAYINRSGQKIKEMNLPYPFVGSLSYNTNADENRLEMISASLAVVKSLSLRLAPGKIDGVRQMAFPSGYCTLQRGSYPGDFTEMQATVVVDPQLSIMLDTEKTEHLISVGNFYDGRATAFSKQASDWDTDPDCVVDITGKILFRIQK